MSDQKVKDKIFKQVLKIIKKYKFDGLVFETVNYEQFPPAAIDAMCDSINLISSKFIKKNYEFISVAYPKKPKAAGKYFYLFLIFYFNF